MLCAIGAESLTLRPGERLLARYRGAGDGVQSPSRGSLRGAFWNDVERGFSEPRDLGLMRIEV